MGEQSSADLLRLARNPSLRNISVDKDETKMHPSQPLNVIAGDGLDYPSPAMTGTMEEALTQATRPWYDYQNASGSKVILTDQSTNGEHEDGSYKKHYPTTNEEGEWEDYTQICEICQIEDIVGTCSHCGIWQYCSNESKQCQFDVKVRRK